MKAATHYIIHNTSAQARAKSVEGRKVLVAQVLEKTGWHAPRSITKKELINILYA